MKPYDSNRVSRLPDWRSSDPSEEASQADRRRGPVVRPRDYVARAAEVEAHPEPVQKPEPILTQEEPVPVALPPDEPVVARVVAPAHAASGVTIDSPLLDTRSVITAIWRRKFLVLILAILFALLGAVALPFAPKKFTASTTLYFDPRQAAGVGEAVSPELMASITDSQVQILTSGKVLKRVVDALDLTKSPIFGGGENKPASSSAIAAVLQKAVKIVREGTSLVMSLTVTTKDPALSAKIANQIVTSFQQEESTASTDLYTETSTALDGRLNDLRQKVQQAEQAVETFRAENDMATSDGNLISDQRLGSLNTLLVTAQERTIQAKARADAASNLRFEDVVSSSQQGTSVSSSLVSLRQQYATLASSVGSLESQLGARHPRLQAAKSSLESLSGEIRSELQRLADSARSDYDQAQKAETAIARQLAVQKAQQANTSDKLIELNALQRNATAARDAYDEVLKRSSQSSESQTLTQNNIRILSEAEPPTSPDGPGRSTLLIAGLLAGLFVGAGAGMVFAIFASLAAHPLIRSYFAK